MSDRTIDDPHLNDMIKPYILMISILQILPFMK